MAIRFSQDRPLSQSSSNASVANSEPEREWERLGHELLEGGSNPILTQSEVRLLMAIRCAMMNMNTNPISAGHGEDLTPTPPAMRPSHILAPSSIHLTLDMDLTLHAPITHAPCPLVNSPSIKAKDALVPALTTKNWFHEVDKHAEGIQEAISNLHPRLWCLQVLELLALQCML